MKSKLSELAQIKFLGKSSIVNKGDILFRRAGNIGETILVKSRKKIDKTQTFVLITADKKIVSPEYLFTVLSSCQSSFKRKSTGNTLKHITLEKLKNHQILIKTKIQQKSITSKYGKLLSNMQSAQTKFDKVEQDFLWILNDAMRSRTIIHAHKYQNWTKLLRFVPLDQRESLIKKLKTKEKIVKKLETEFKKQQQILNKFKIS
jgi:hypothetical protein